MKVQQVVIPSLPVSKKEKLFFSGAKNFIRQRRHSELLLIGVVALDFLLFNAILVLSMGREIGVNELFTNHFESIMLFLFISNVIGVFVASFTEVYEMFEGVKLNLKIKNLFWSTLIFFGIISLVYYQFFFSKLEIHFLVPAFICFTILSTVIHTITRIISLRYGSSYLSYAIIGGKMSSFNYLQNVLASVFGRNITCIGRFADDKIPGVRNLGTFDDIANFISHNNPINKLVYIDSNLSAEEVQKLGKLCRSHFIDFDVMPAEIDFFAKATQIEQLAHLPILRRKKEPLHLSKNRILKRGFDIIFSLMVILLIFPWLFPIIAILIRLESKGPIFFSQYRTGYWSKPFKCLKFRSMRVNNDCDRVQATKNDNRITKIGAFLRKTNLDELPQFFNVLKGEMSVVGPRPHMLKHTEDYSKLIDSYMIRHEVKPGITGWAQVNGWRGPTVEVYKMINRVEYDIDYIENWNFWFDCKCIFLTVFNMVKGENEAF